MSRLRILSRFPVLVFGGAVVGLIIVRFAAAISLIAIIPLGVMLLVALTKGLIRWPDDPEAKGRILRWTLAAFAIHLLVGVLITSNSTLVTYLGPDASTYNSGAQALANYWSNGGPFPSLPPGKEGFFYLLGGLYWLFGPSTFGGVALNAVLGAAIVPVVSDTTHRLFGLASARYVPAIIVLVPGMIIWPSQLLKEAAFLLLLAVVANAAVRLVDRISLGPVCVLAVGLPGLLTLRGQLGLAIMGGLVAGIVLGRKAVSGGLFGAVVASFLIAGVLALGVGSAGYEKAVNSNLTQANNARRGLESQANSGFAGDTDISTPQRALSFLPVGLATVAIGPFPWQLQGARQLVAVPDLFAWWVLGVATCWGWAAARRTTGRRLFVVVFPAIATMAVIALVIGNYGTIVRERMQVLVLLAPLMALGFASRRVWREAEARKLAPVG